MRVIDAYIAGESSFSVIHVDCDVVVIVMVIRQATDGSLKRKDGIGTGAQESLAR